MNITLTPEQQNLIQAKIATGKYQSSQEIIGQVGTIVEIYNEVNPYQYLVEFADTQGREYAMATVKADEILVLHYELKMA